MLLKIDDHTTVDSLQDTFSECFPHLRIDFFSSLRDQKENKPAEGDMLLGDVRSQHDPGILELKSWFRYEDVELLFKKQSGLLVNIYRRTEDDWQPLQKNDLLSYAGTISSAKKEDTDTGTDDEEIRLDLPYGS
jgi:hypothetical protein